MSKAITKRSLLLAAFTALAVLVLVPSASAANAPGSLRCPTLSQYNNTHYGLAVGTTVTCTIEGATDVSNGPVDVIIKSTTFGNTTVTGTAAGGVITFTFTAPNNGCDTVIVAYETSGNNSNNDFIDDGVKNGSGTSSAGFGYVNAQGQPILCSTTAVAFRSFMADRTARGVLVRWSTGSEAGTIGYNVYREVSGKRVKLNHSLVHASSGVQGHAYKLLDRRGATGSRYWIQSVERNGARAWYGSTTAR